MGLARASAGLASYVSQTTTLVGLCNGPIAGSLDNSLPGKCMRAKGLEPPRAKLTGT